MIYCIQSGDRALVKIGYCLGDPKRRLAQLQCGNPEPLNLIAVKDGGKEAESHWHAKFAHLRVRGEWFKWCDELRDWALPLLADPDELKEAKIQHARDLIAGRTSSRDVYERLFSAGSWSPERRRSFAERLNA